jgi:hypothetical protein
VSSRADLAKVCGASWTERRLVTEAMAWLGLFRLAIAVLPFRWVVSLSRLAPATDTEPPDSSLTDAGSSLTDAGHQIRWALQAASAHTPWLSTCLSQSLAGSVMLRRRGVVSTVYLGVGKDQAGEFVAHSWLRGGDTVVIGGAGHESFSIIAAYRHGAVGTHRAASEA